MSQPTTKGNKPFYKIAADFGLDYADVLNMAHMVRGLGYSYEVMMTTAENITGKLGEVGTERFSEFADEVETSCNTFTAIQSGELAWVP